MLARKKQAAATACSICVLLLTGKWFQLIVRPTNSPQQGLQRLQSPGGRKQAKEGKKWCQQRSGGKFKLPGRLSVNTDRSRAIITLRARVILLKWPFNDYCMPGLLLVVALVGRQLEGEPKMPCMGACCQCVPPNWRPVGPPWRVLPYPVSS